MTAHVPHHPSGPAAHPRRGRLTRALAALLALAFLLALALLLRADGHAAAPVHAGTSVLEDADVHVDTGERAIDVALSQTQNACGATALNGRFCLRYSIEEDETPVAAGYGVIAASPSAGRTMWCISRRSSSRKVSPQMAQRPCWRWSRRAMGMSVAQCVRRRLLQ
jgi:hypothetical protein